MLLGQIMNAPSVWIIDSGSTDHICGDRSQFISYRTVKEKIVTATNEVAWAFGRGDVILSLLQPSGEVRQMLLSNVLHGPVGSNLISTTRLATKQVKVCLNGINEASYIAFNGEVVGYTDIREDLYQLRIAPPHRAEVCLTATSESTAHRDVKIDEDAAYKPGESEITLFPWTEQDDLLLAGLEHVDSPSLTVPTTTDLSSAESSDLSLPPSGEPSCDEASEEDNEPLHGFKPRDSTRSKGTTDWSLWKEAMQSDYDSLMENSTWDLVHPPTDTLSHKPLTGKWVFRIKKKEDGSIKRKTWWVVHSYRQEQGINYEETFASVVKAVSHRSIISTAAKGDLYMEQMDIVTAFLYGLLDELVYVSTKFRMTDMGPATRYLGIEIERHPTGITLHQRSYLMTVLQRFEMDKYHPTATPMDAGVPGFMMPPLIQASKATIKRYQSAVGCLMYAMVYSRAGNEGLVGYSDADMLADGSPSPCRRRAFRCSLRIWACRNTKATS